MIIAMNIWLAANIVFGLWTSKNILTRFYAIAVGKKYKQNDLGKMLDLLVISSVLAYFFND